MYLYIFIALFTSSLNGEWFDDCESVMWKKNAIADSDMEEVDLVQILKQG